MLRFILYALLVFVVIQMIRSTVRIKSNARKWEEEDEGVQKPPTLNIPDIQDAKFEDLPGAEDDTKEKPKEPPAKP